MKQLTSMIQLTLGSNTYQLLSIDSIGTFSTLHNGTRYKLKANIEYSYGMKLYNDLPLSSGKSISELSFLYSDYLYSIKKVFITQFSYEVASPGEPIAITLEFISDNVLKREEMKDTFLE